MTAFALQVRVGRLDNVHCSFGGGGGGASLWICGLLIVTLLGSNGGAALSPDGQTLLNFLDRNSEVLDPTSGFSSWNASDDTPCEWLRVFCGPDYAVRRLDLSACTGGLTLTEGSSDQFSLYDMASLESLQELDLSSNSHLEWHDIHFLTGLTWLDVSGTSDAIVQDNVGLPSLQYLKAAEGSGWSAGLIQNLDKMRGLVALSLANNALLGVLPQEVRELTKLVSLDLSGNSFSGSIPSLEGLTRLAQLSLAGNDFSGDVPAAPNLEFLDAPENSFTNLTDSFFQVCAQCLKQVNLSRNQLAGQLPGNVSLKFLQVLDMSWNGLQGPIPYGLGTVGHLDLSNNNLSGPIPQDIASSLVYSVVWVDLSGNNLTGTIPDGLLYGAEYVNLSRNALVGNIPDNAESVVQFVSSHLDLSDNQLDGPLPPSFSTLFPSQLWLQNNSFTGDLIALISDALDPAQDYSTDFVMLSIRVQGNRFTGDLTNLLDSWLLTERAAITVLDFSHNRFNMTPSERFPNPLQSMLETLCNATYGYEDQPSPLQELRLAGSDLMGQPLPDKFNCFSSSNSLDSLQILDVASCNLTGTVPKFAIFNSNMPRLAFLNISNNRLSGPIPDRLPDTLSVLDLSNNNLVSEGGVPAGLFIGLPLLVHFNASNNKLSGPVPGTFPPTLRVLDLSHNNLTGAIPGSLFFALLHLEYINLSGNNLSGTIPDGLNLTVFKASSFADNPGLCGVPLPPCIAPQPPAQAADRINVLVLVTVVVAAVLVSTCSCLLLVWRWRVYSKKHQQDRDLIATLLEGEPVTLMSLRQLRKATSNFSESAQIGVGGFGTVYTGKLADGTQVAIKKGKREGSAEYKQQFLNEVRILSGVNHRHLVKLLGCSMENKIALLVFEFVPNGTLQEHLQGKRDGFSPLSWRQRILIALQTSDALAYLHSAADPPIFHRDVKSSNILLDHDLNAKVADFGISKLAPSKEATHVSTVAMGTIGYLDPEYYVRFQLTPGSDVYSFGIVLLELMSAKPAVDFARGDEEAGLASLASSAMDKGEWEGLIDPVLADTYGLPNGKASIDCVGDLAVRCLAFRSRERPNMRQVWKALQTVWLHWESDASFQLDSVRHDLQPLNASPDVYALEDCMSPHQSSNTSRCSSSSTFGPEIEMQHL